MDPNLFAQLYPMSMSAAQVVLGNENKHLFAPKIWNRGKHGVSSSELTDSGQERLELHFDNQKRPFKDLTQGWLFGANPRNADVALGETVGISRRHFAIAVTSNHHVYLHQLSVHDRLTRKTTTKRPKKPQRRTSPSTRRRIPPWLSCLAGTVFFLIHPGKSDIRGRQRQVEKSTGCTRR